MDVALADEDIHNKVANIITGLWEKEIGRRN